MSRKCFPQRCLNCTRYSNHHHHPYRPGAACEHEGCKCPYFYGWKAAQRRFDLKFKNDWKNKKAEKLNNENDKGISTEERGSFAGTIQGKSGDLGSS